MELLKHQSFRYLAAIVFAGTILGAQASHQSWRFSEAFSNADGSLQFVEMVSNADGHDKIACCRVVAENKTTGVDTP